MALSLTCVCDARFELEDTLAGQTITCPECQQPLKAPSVQTTGSARRTNLLALLSAVLAVVGAFTLIGSAAAVVLGSMALVRIGRNPEREAGSGLALFGILSGVAFTTLMLFALFAGELFGLGAWWRQKTLGDQVDITGPLEHTDGNKGFTITRPNRKWAEAVNKDFDDPFVKALASPTSDLMLISLARPVFIEVQAETVNARSLKEWENNIVAEWDTEDRPDQMAGFPGGRRGPQFRVQRESPFEPKLDKASLRSWKNVDVPRGEGREMEADVIVANQRWHVLVRLYRPSKNKVYVVKVFAHRKKTFQALKTEIDSILDSFKELR